MSIQRDSRRPLGSTCQGSFHRSSRFRQTCRSRLYLRHRSGLSQPYPVVVQFSLARHRSQPVHASGHSPKPFSRRGGPKRRSARARRRVTSNVYHPGTVIIHIISRNLCSRIRLSRNWQWLQALLNLLAVRLLAACSDPSFGNHFADTALERYVPSLCLRTDARDAGRRFVTLTWPRISFQRMRDFKLGPGKLRQVARPEVRIQQHAQDSGSCSVRSLISPSS